MRRSRRCYVSDNWYIRKVLKRNFYDVDLFGYMLPLRDEASFFGRQQIAARYIDAIKRCENRGVFGLRKTGKTSFLFKLDRIIREQHLTSITSLITDDATIQDDLDSDIETYV